MDAVVITIIGDDRSGLVDSIAGVIAAHGANWDRSHLAELSGKFAGIVLVNVPAVSTDALLADLDALDAQGLLAITAERTALDAAAGEGTHVVLELVGQDHPGIVHEIAHLLAQLNVSIDELETAVAPAPQGGNLFIANALLQVPDGVTVEGLRTALEDVAHDLMVDLEIVPR